MNKASEQKSAITSDMCPARSPKQAADGSLVYGNTDQKRMRGLHVSNRAATNSGLERNGKFRLRDAQQL
jgi:hypothetical protein